MQASFTEKNRKENKYLLSTCVPGLALSACLFVISYFTVFSKQSYKLAISDRGDTIYLDLQPNIAGNEIRLADINYSQAYFTLLE